MMPESSHVQSSSSNEKGSDHRSALHHDGRDLVFIIKTSSTCVLVDADRVGGAAKSVINAHVAKLSHEKRRQKETFCQDPRVSWTFHTITHDVIDDALKYRMQEQPEATQIPTTSHEKAVGLRKYDRDKHAPPKARTSPPHQPWATLNVLQRGNSDPFDALAIPIDPWANRFMDFGKTFLIPALYQNGKRGWVPSSPAARNWHAGIKDLSDQCAAFGLMAYYATAMTIVGGDAYVARRALVFKTKAVQLLRDQMAQQLPTCSSNADPFLLGLVFRLFRTEVLGRNVEAAEVHGNMLRIGMERQSAAGTLDLGFLSLVVYHDNHRSTSSMVRPLFDYNDFVPRAFSAVWQNVPLQLPVEAEADLGEPDCSITDPVTRTILTEMRPFLLVYSLMATKRRTSASTSNWFWFLSKSETFQGRLMNRYLDLTMSASPAGESAAVRGVECAFPAQLQACICLAALFTIRSPTDNPMVAGIPLYNSAAMVLHRLAVVLRAVEAHLVYDPDSLATYPSVNHALVWTYYVGALAELRSQLGTTPDRFFHPRLSRKIHEMSLVSWDQMASIFHNFLYSEVYCAPYDPEQWFKMVAREHDH